MAGLRRARFRDNVREMIAEVARKQMANSGTAAVSLRAIARDLNLTAPALYRYFHNRDDLITALILDAFNSLADTLTEADASAQAAGVKAPWDRMMAVLGAYRNWALTHPIDFQLIYGNPIPGYEAPAQLTVPAARRGFEVVIAILGEALASGSLKLPELPPSISAHLAGVVGHDGYDTAPEVLYLAVVGWTRIHGIIMLELFEHIQPVIGDPDTFYRFEVSHLLSDMRLTPPG